MINLGKHPRDQKDDEHGDGAERQKKKPKIAELDFRLPKLPLPDLFMTNYPKGPTPMCYWAIPNRLLVSRHPLEEQEFKAIYATGVRVWVRLNKEDKGPDTILPDYPKLEGSKFLKFLMAPDNAKTDVDIKMVEQASDAILATLNQGHIICMHCRGGNSRSGCVTARVLSKFYSLTIHQALVYLRVLKATRASSHKKYVTLWPRQKKQMIAAFSAEDTKFQVPFYSKGSDPATAWLSNFHKNKGQVLYEGLSLGHYSETDYQYQKALHFGDKEISSKISGVDNPATAKALGQKVKGFVAGHWEKGGAAFEAMLGVLRRKLVADPALRDKLKATGTAILVEATTNDKRWASGLSPKDSGQKLPHTWPGSNWLGGAWMAVRDEITY